VDPGNTWLPALVGLAVGAAAGWGIRLLLARLRRGVVVRTGILELASALVTGVGVALSWPGPLVALVVWAGVLGVGLGAVDLVHHRLPDALTLPAVPITLLLVGITELAAPAAGSVITALVVAVVVGAAFWALSALAPRSMGLGDVKLVPSLALMTGYVSVATGLLAVVIAFVLGALVAMVGMLSRRLSLDSAIPFGPFLLAGCWLVLVCPGLVTAVVG
jgi:leader peptidase (prepilin peptidase)/N-methyltransferase